VKIIYIFMPVFLILASCLLLDPILQEPTGNYMAISDKYVVLLPDGIPNLYEIEGEKEVEVLSDSTTALTVFADEVGYILIVDIDKNPIALVEVKADSTRHWIYKEGKPIECSYEEYNSFLENYEKDIQFKETEDLFEWTKYVEVEYERRW